MKLQTERLILREWRDEDRDDYAALTGDPQVRRFYPTVLTRAEADEQMNRHLAMQSENPFHFRAVTTLDGTFVGTVGMAYIADPVRTTIPTHPEIEIGWLVHTRFWGQGLAPEAALACLAQAWQLGLSEIVAFTAAINTPSQRVMEKIGMTRDPAADYEHPFMPEGHPLRPHVLYRISAKPVVR